MVWKKTLIFYRRTFKLHAHTHSCISKPPAPLIRGAYQILSAVACPVYYMVRFSLLLREEVYSTSTSNELAIPIAAELWIGMVNQQKEVQQDTAYSAVVVNGIPVPILFFTQRGHRNMKK